MAGFLLAALTYFPLFHALTHFANPALEAAQAKAPVTVSADPNRCSFQFNPVGTAKFTTSCDILKGFLARNSVSYTNEVAPAGSVAKMKIGDVVVEGFEATGLPADQLKTKTDALNKSAGDAIKAAGYPSKADPSQINYVMTTLVLWILVLYVTMVYGPIAAMLV